MKESVLSLSRDRKYTDLSPVWLEDTCCCCGNHYCCLLLQQAISAAAFSEINQKKTAAVSSYNTAKAAHLVLFPSKHLK